MGDPSAIEVATRRLQQALDALEVAVERRLDAAREEDKLANQLGLLSADRSRLAVELDAVASRARRLEGANPGVARPPGIRVGQDPSVSAAGCALAPERARAGGGRP